MRIMTVALGSFVLGVGAMFLLGNHTSTVPQSVFAQQPGAFNANPAAVPVVPPLGTGRKITSSGSRYSGVQFEVDGTESKGDKFQNVTFEYGGGAYKLEDAEVTAPANIKLVGAAANTAQFLALFGMLGCPSKNPQPPEANPNQPIMKTISFETPLRGNFSSRYGQ